MTVMHIGLQARQGCASSSACLSHYTVFLVCRWATSGWSRQACSEGEATTRKWASLRPASTPETSPSTSVRLLAAQLCSFPEPWYMAQ